MPHSCIAGGKRWNILPAGKIRCCSRSKSCRLPAPFAIGKNALWPTAPSSWEKRYVGAMDWKLWFCRTVSTLLCRKAYAASPYPRELMQSLSSMEAPQGALFVCKCRSAAAIASGRQPYPGWNPGSREPWHHSADCGRDGYPVALTDGCADPYGEKTVRASMGAVFRSQPRRPPEGCAGLLPQFRYSFSGHGLFQRTRAIFARHRCGI